MYERGFVSVKTTIKIPLCGVYLEDAPKSYGSSSRGGSLLGPFLSSTRLVGATRHKWPPPSIPFFRGLRLSCWLNFIDEKHGNPHWIGWLATRCAKKIVASKRGFRQRSSERKWGCPYPPLGYTDRSLDPDSWTLVSSRFLYRSHSCGWLRPPAAQKGDPPLHTAGLGVYTGLMQDGAW